MTHILHYQRLGRLIKWSAGTAVVLMIAVACAPGNASSNKAAGEAFLSENGAREGVVTLPSGLQYEVLEDGSGKSPTGTDEVVVHYKGTLIDGTEFDSSYQRGQPARFPLNRVIKGWTEGVQLMQEGAKWRLYVPSELAYGSRSVGGKIKPDSTLIFDIELIEVVE